MSVIGNGYHGMTVAGVGDQAGGTFLSKSQRVDNFLSCFIQSRGRKILRKHGQGQIQNNDEGVILLFHWLGQFFPGGPGKADGGH